MSRKEKPLRSHQFVRKTFVTRRIEDLTADAKATPRDRAEAFECYTLALDESTDKRGTAQLAVFVRGVDQKFFHNRRVRITCTTEGEENWHRCVRGDTSSHERYGTEARKNCVG